jgi:predicted Zn finger-like uncharacterized protein
MAMRLTCPTCGARYEIADGMIAPEGQHVQCSNCHARWFERPATREPGDRFGEDEIIARLDRRTGGSGGRTRPDRRPPAGGPAHRDGTEFSWEGGGEAPAGGSQSARPQPGHLRLVEGDAGANLDEPARAAGDAPAPESAAPDPAPAAAPSPAAALSPAAVPPPAAAPSAAAPVSRPTAAGGVPQPGARSPAPSEWSREETAPPDVEEDSAAPGADLRPAQPVRPAHPVRAAGERGVGAPPPRAVESGRLDLGGAVAERAEQPQRRRRSGGLVVGLALVVLLIVLYLAAEHIVGIVPWVADPLAAYTSTIESLLLQGEARIASLADSLRSAGAGAD